MDLRLDELIRAQSEEQLTLAQNQQQELQAFWMSEKQEFKPRAEKLESILQPHLFDRKEAKKSQRMNQQLIRYLESPLPPGAGGPNISGCMGDIATELFTLLRAITKDTGHESYERQSILVAWNDMEDAETHMKQLEHRCIIRARQIAGRLSDYHDDSHTVPVQSLTNSELKKRVNGNKFKV